MSLPYANSRRRYHRGMQGKKPSPNTAQTLSSSFESCGVGSPLLWFFALPKMCAVNDVCLMYTTYTYITILVTDWVPRISWKMGLMQVLTRSQFKLAESHNYSLFGQRSNVFIYASISAKGSRCFVLRQHLKCWVEVSRLGMTLLFDAGLFTVPLSPTKKW